MLGFECNTFLLKILQQTVADAKVFRKEAGL
jgi:hypothetical protein